jgi:hypothetical protein
MLVCRSVKTRAILPVLPVLPVLAVVVLGCSGSTSSIGGGSDSGAAVTTDQAATDVANAYCNRAQACAPAYITISFGDGATCTTRLKATLLPGMGATGSTETPAQYEACAASVPSATCDDLLARTLPAPCQPVPGTLAIGAACAVDGQCASTHCGLPANAACGTCVGLAGAGGACNVDDDCQDGMTCQSNACVAYGAENAMCDTTHPCLPDLGCKSGACTAPSPAGTACQSGAECDNLHGVFCNPVSMMCEAVSFAGANAACGLVNMQLVVCTGPGSLCTGETAPSYAGSCVPYAADGAACDATNGPLCNAGAVCVGGKCAVPDPSQCQ